MEVYRSKLHARIEDSLCVAPDRSLHCCHMAAKTHIFQAPKGTRDFYPQDLAVRRYIESVWRQTAISHGFDEIDGPTFEHLELYTTKSGPGIVSELFSFKRDKGDTDYALRPEFTPTLARMYAAQAGSLPKPTKWFSIGPYFRAERPQRGRLREHIQLNVDVIGDESPAAEAEIIAVAVRLLEGLGLSSQDVQIKISHRELAAEILRRAGVSDDCLPTAFELLDRRSKMTEDEFILNAVQLGISGDAAARFQMGTMPANSFVEQLNLIPDVSEECIAPLRMLDRELTHRSVQDWCQFDFGIVRGLAYYTGTVFEIHETTGKERAIAGGGRYDNLVELFGGPPTAACGFAIGDVVLRLILEDHGLLKPAEQYLPTADVFVINARDEEPQKRLMPLVTNLRSAGLHARHSYKATRNVGKLLSEANKARAKFAVILGEELDKGIIVIKDLKNGGQDEVKADTLLETLQVKLANSEGG